MSNFFFIRRELILFVCSFCFCFFCLQVPACAEGAGLNVLGQKPGIAKGAGPDEVTELWTGTIYTASYRVAVCVRPDGALRGVLYLRGYTGNVDVYHIHGHVTGNRVEASHSSGHHFTGRLDGGDAVTGTIRLKSGMSINLKGHRRKGVPVTPDCAPMPG